MKPIKKENEQSILSHFYIVAVVRNKSLIHTALRFVLQQKSGFQLSLLPTYICLKNMENFHDNIVQYITITVV